MAQNPYHTTHLRHRAHTKQQFNTSGEQTGDGPAPGFSSRDECYTTERVTARRTRTTVGRSFPDDPAVGPVFGGRPEHPLTLSAPASTTTTTTSTRHRCRPTVPVPRSSRGPSCSHQPLSSRLLCRSTSTQAVGPGSGSSRRPNDTRSGCCPDGNLVVGRRSLAPV